MRSFYASISKKRTALTKIALFLVLNLMLATNSFADYTVNANQTVDASTLTGQSGVLTIYGKLNVSSDVLLGFTTVIINGPGGQIYWSKNSTLSFSAGTNIIINTGAPGLQPTGGNAAQVLAIGSTIIAVSNDNSNKGDFSFTQFNSQGGLPQYTITSNAPVCAGTALSLAIAPNKAASGINYTYKWSVSPAAVSFSPNSTNTSVTISPAAGDYVITCIATAKGSGDTYDVTQKINVSVRAANTWLGITNTWNDARNWCPGVPTITSNITIPATTNNPVIPQGVFAVDDITIAAGASLTINGTLQIAGKLLNSGMLDVTKGTIELNGTQAQTISGSSFVRKTLNNLIISNKAGVNLSTTTNDTLNITGTVSFGTSNATLNTYDNLTLKSTAAGTASVSDLTNNGTVSGNKITGNVIVERYLNIGTAPGQHGKAWEFIAAPATGQSVRQAWMENGNLTSTGYGIQISGPGGIPAGFDVASPSPSMKYYDDATQNWIGIPNTTNPVYDQRGYMVFVRGDRSVNGSTVTTPTPTTLRTKGSLVTGDITIALPASNAFASIGNPYASAIDMSKVVQNTGSDFFYVWNSSLGGVYGYGAYETYLKIGQDYYSVPGMVKNNFIQSGQAFFVQTTKKAGSITIKESSKNTTSSVKIFRQEATSGKITQLSADLYAANTDGSTVLIDGTIQQFSDDYSNDIDEMDAKKIFNSNENLSIKSGGKDIIVERRSSVTEKDTISLTLTGMKVQNYRLEFTANNLSANGMQGFVEDSYLKTVTPINMEGSTTLNFSVVNVAASYAPNRFRIVFKQITAPLPVTIASVKATQKNADIAVEWKVENESNMKQYEVEKSTDGNKFNKVASIAANNKGAGIYNWLDNNASAGFNYYRIRSVDINGQINYSQIVKVQTGKMASEMSVYPNPAINATVNLQLTNQPAGMYYVRVINPVGQVIISKQIIHAGGSSTETIKLNEHSSKGIYQLEITSPNGETKVIKVMNS